MPSPTVNTVPVSMTSTVLSYDAICCWMMREISSARSCIGYLVIEPLSAALQETWSARFANRESVGELVFELAETVADAAVEHLVADARHHAAKQRSIHARGDDH